MRISNRLLGYILLSALLAVASACSSGRSSDEKQTESEVARRYGREQALRLQSTEDMDTIEMEKILIDVKVRETTLRRHGEEELADSYIEAFIATLDSVNPRLCAEIGAK